MSDDAVAPEAKSPAKAENPISPLPGEVGIPSVTQTRKMAFSRKGVVALALSAGFFIALTAASIDRSFFANKKDVDAKRTGDRPTAAAAEPRQLDLSLPPVAK